MTGCFVSTYFKRYSLRVNTEFKPQNGWGRGGENIEFHIAREKSVIIIRRIFWGFVYKESIDPVFDIAEKLIRTKGNSQ